jgi:DNA mismatch repair protein MutS
VMAALGVLNLEGFGISREHPALGAAGALIHYATETLCATPQNLRQLREFRSENTLLLDPATLRSLEIFKSADNTRKGSLLAAMNGTVTAPGARCLERWLSAPQRDLQEIQRRQQCVGEFVTSQGLNSELKNQLKGIRDLDRILGRLQNRMRSPARARRHPRNPQVPSRYRDHTPRISRHPRWPPLRRASTTSAPSTKN